MQPDFDFVFKTLEYFSKEVGNRIATWLFYLDVPEKGGATVFPIINAKIRPQRGSAVFWYNLHPSGNKDFRSFHAACPVLFGQKWISNKWLHERSQEFKRPCTLINEKSEQ